MANNNSTTEGNREKNVQAVEKHWCYRCIRASWFGLTEQVWKENWTCRCNVGALSRKKLFIFYPTCHNFCLTATLKGHYCTVYWAPWWVPFHSRCCNGLSSGWLSAISYTGLDNMCLKQEISLCAMLGLIFHLTSYAFARLLLVSVVFVAMLFPL